MRLRMRTDLETLRTTAAVCLPPRRRQGIVRPAQPEDAMPRAALIAALLLAAPTSLAQTALAQTALAQTSLAQTALAQTAATVPPARAQAATVPTPAQGPAAAPARAARPAAAPMALGANQFTTEAAAQAHCSTDGIVWVNPRSKAYHLKGTRYYGHTRTGAYMCHKDADAGGMHPTPGEKPATTASAQ